MLTLLSAFGVHSFWPDMRLHPWGSVAIVNFDTVSSCIISSARSAMAPLMILAVLLMGQSVDASCPIDQGVLMQLRASGMINDTTTDGTCDALAQSVYTSVPEVGGGPFAVATPTPQDSSRFSAVEAVSQCGRAEGARRVTPLPLFACARRIALEATENNVS
jgi:hypothetical protein